MNTDNVVEFLRLLSLDVSLGAAAQHAASQADAPLALARLATAHGLPCSAADWSVFACDCLDGSDGAHAADLPDEARIWQLVQDPGQGTGMPASAITRVIGIATQPDGPAVVGHVVNDLAPRPPQGSSSYPRGS
ncbi:MAG: hypothetical protein ACWGIK_14015 [Achromobacter pulmonis]|uniref:Uncharacterized protein n=1 Tax=Achromobacter pulmonis TaxID=1389932 RepID=A0A6S7CTY6_9BURK|nr:hypothetical protein [Achromobacter pulmonis]MPT25833.1 hypothetical protein [Achromobacter sp.]CAB3862131.1 hypothetical protein LMG26788_02327 [Achromobacter pulmonis]